MLNGIVVVLHRDGRCVALLAQPDNVGSIPQRLTVVVNIVSLWLPTGTLVNARVDLAVRVNISDLAASELLITRRV